MAKLYVGQDLRITLTGCVGLTAGTAVIQCKQGGLSGGPINGKSAEIEDYATAKCWADFNSENIIKAGTWKFWLKLTFSDGKIGIGEPVSITFNNPGD